MKCLMTRTTINRVFSVIHEVLTAIMVTSRRLYTWQELDEIPMEPGVYAWYYRHTFYKADIETLLIDLATIGPQTSDNLQARKDRVEAFLQYFLFNFFLEEPYKVSLRGALKPAYEGTVSHVATITAGLVERITTDPTRLWNLQSVLDSTVPEFAAPIYIGLSKDLRKRIKRHRSLMQKYKEIDGKDLRDDGASEEEKKDQSFAREVIRRGFLLHRLEVSVRIIDTPGDIYLDAENILNRINFPLCGRN